MEKKALIKQLKNLSSKVDKIDHRFQDFDYSTLSPAKKMEVKHRWIKLGWEDVELEVMLKEIQEFEAREEEQRLRFSSIEHYNAYEAKEREKAQKVQAMFQEAESIMFEINKKPEEPKISKQLAALRKRKRDGLEKLGLKGV